MDRVLGADAEPEATGVADPAETVVLPPPGSVSVDAPLPLLVDDLSDS